MKTYLITGAAQGLGHQLSKQLVERGDQVILLDKELKALNKLYDELEAISENKAALYPMDLLGANIDHYKELSQLLKDNFEQIDGIILNAAILPAFTPIEHFDYKQWYEVLHVNLNANFHLIQQYLQICKTQKEANIITISDNNINENPAYYGAYGVAKAGLEQLMKTVANETRKQGVDCYLAKLNTFATEARGRLFPGENPNDLISADSMASFVLQAHSMKDNELINEHGIIEKL